MANVISGFEELTSDRIEGLGIEDIIPTTGYYMGLDISKTSTGITVFQNGEFTWDSFGLNIDDPSSVHSEALYRRALRDELLERIDGMQFEVIVVEDVYAGVSATTSRLLYSLNTVIDDLILDGKISCKVFERVQNGAWKKWLMLTEYGLHAKSLNDKQKVVTLMSDLGIETYGKGAQDRLDSAGMITGYLIHQMMLSGDSRVGQVSQSTDLIPLRDIRVVYGSNKEDVPDGIVYDGRVSEAGIRRVLSEADAGVMYRTKTRVSIGNLGTKLGVEPLPFGGYLTFWRV